MRRIVGGSRVCRVVHSAMALKAILNATHRYRKWIVSSRVGRIKGFIAFPERAHGATALVVTVSKQGASDRIRASRLSLNGGGAGSWETTC